VHELSIAMSIVEIAQEERERLGGRVSAVHLKLGPMAGVVKDALLFSYDVACQDTPLEGSRLLIEEVPLVVFCPQCEVQRVVSPLHALCCPECGTPTPEIRGGRELEIVAMEIVE
jgi:hydrogenase nickel incorporation protein HypA/HybF